MIELQDRALFLPDEAKMVSKHLAVAQEDGNITFFNASGPILTFKADDEAFLRLAAAILSDPELGLATPSQVGKALGRHRGTVNAYRNKYPEGGVEALRCEEEGPKGTEQAERTHA